MQLPHHISTVFPFSHVAHMRSRPCLTELLASSTDAESLAQLHSLLLRSGLLAAADCFFATRLSSAYGNLRLAHHARKLFDEITHPSKFLCNAILRAHSRAGQWPQTLALFRRMVGSLPSGYLPDEFAFSVALKECAGLSALLHGQAVHALAVKARRSCSDMFVGSALVELYSGCGEMGDAVAVFEGFPEPDVVLRTSVVTGYQRNGDAEGAVSFFSTMVTGKGVVPDPVTLISVVSALTQLGNLIHGKSCHGYIIRMGFEYKLPLVNSILNLYAKLGEINSSSRLFDRMHARDVFTWSSMVSCYATHGDSVAAFDVYRKMTEIGIEPNSITLVSVLQACALARDLNEGRKVHEFAAQKGYDMEMTVSTALIDMYMNCSCYSEAIDIFHQMPKKDVVTWAAFISGCAQNGMTNESLEVFKDMLSDGPKPDAVIMVKVLIATSQLGILHQALCIYAFLIKSGFDKKVFVVAALIDLYSKCGSLDDVIAMFKITDEKDVVLWSSMIAAYGVHGLGTKAIATYEQMIKSGIRPNSVTLIALLSACSHAGLVEEGRRIFHSMSQDFGVIPTSEHYCIMVDLLGRTGKLQEALRLIQCMPNPVSPHIWCALLSACVIHHNVEIGELVARNLLKIEPEHAGYYNLLSNIYAFDEKWDKMTEVKSLMKKKGIRKTPGYSSIEVNNEVHTFLAGERLQQGWKMVRGLLRELTMNMKEEGYFPVLLGVEDLNEG